MAFRSHHILLRTNILYVYDDLLLKQVWLHDMTRLITPSNMFLNFIAGRQNVQLHLLFPRDSTVC